MHINFNTEENNSLILTNKFNILFAHEISDINHSSLDIFKQKLYIYFNLPNLRSVFK